MYGSDQGEVDRIALGDPSAAVGIERGYADERVLVEARVSSPGSRSGPPTSTSAITCLARLRSPVTATSLFIGMAIRCAVSTAARTLSIEAPGSRNWMMSAPWANSAETNDAMSSWAVSMMTRVRASRSRTSSPMSAVTATS